MSVRSLNRQRSKDSRRHEKTNTPTGNYLMCPRPFGRKLRRCRRRVAGPMNGATFGFPVREMGRLAGRSTAGARLGPDLLAGSARRYLGRQRLEIRIEAVPQFVLHLDGGRKAANFSKPSIGRFHLYRFFMPGFLSVQSKRQCPSCARHEVPLRLTGRPLRQEVSVKSRQTVPLRRYSRVGMK